MLLSNALIEHARRQPEKAAVISAEQSITYGELDLAVDRLARHFLNHGLKPGDRVAVHWPNSVEHVTLMLGALRAGLVVVPINPRLKTPEIAYLLEHSGARLCFSEPALASLVAGVDVMTELPPLTASGEALPDVDPDAPAMILYTSGTTARPKGVTHTQRTLFENARECINHAICSDDRPLAISQMSHIGALVAVYLVGLLQGASVVLLRSFETGAALDIIERFRCTYLFSLPALLQEMAEEQSVRPRDISSLRGILAGGDSVSVALQQRVCEQFHLELLEGCGMTEVVPFAVNPRGAVRPGSIGLPANASIRIVDCAGNELESGNIGEMLIRSPGNCIGYWNDPEATAQLFKDGWLHTGDLASRDADGYLWFKGRLKQIIIRGGSNISPQEVEEAMYQHPDVLEAGVVGLPDSALGEVPVAYVALREGCCTSREELMVHARALLSDYKVPQQIFFLERLPKGLTGKVDRRCLREMLQAETDRLENRVGLPV